MSEDIETCRKRLYMRSIRRGIKEMDIILTRFADTHMPGMDMAEMALYDALLSESDHDLYQWVTGQISAPERYAPLMDRLISGAEGLTKP